jgi:hypothetical protein
MSTAETSSISNKEIADREKCLDSLGEFIDKCQEDITSMLDSLGWTPEHFMQVKALLFVVFFCHFLIIYT